MENLKPLNAIQINIQRGNISEIIVGAAKFDKQDATLVPWLNVVVEEENNHQFYCNSVDMNMIYYYDRRMTRCFISSPSIITIVVECRSMEEYRRLLTFVLRMENNGFWSLKSCSPNHKAPVHEFSESIFSYVKNGFPPEYELELEKVVLT